MKESGLHRIRSHHAAIMVGILFGAQRPDTLTDVVDHLTVPFQRTAEATPSTGEKVRLNTFEVENTI